MTEATNAKDSRQNKITFSFIAEQILLPFASTSNMIREVENVSPNFKQIARRYFTLLNILIWIARFIIQLS